MNPDERSLEVVVALEYRDDIAYSQNNWRDFYTDTTLQSSACNVVGSIKAPSKKPSQHRELRINSRSASQGISPSSSSRIRIECIRACLVVEIIKAPSWSYTSTGPWWDACPASQGNCKSNSLRIRLECIRANLACTSKAPSEILSYRSTDYLEAVLARLSSNKLAHMNWLHPGKCCDTENQSALLKLY